jgi:hypothetical protein
MRHPQVRLIIENNRTLPYGEAWLATDNGATSTNEKKFTTYQRDHESGLDYAMEAEMTEARCKRSEKSPMCSTRTKHIHCATCWS